MTSTIPLTKGYTATVDDDLRAALMQHQWYAQEDRGGQVYACRSSRSSGTVYLHREVMRLRGITAAADVDHINRDTLDCRAENLRPATRAQNNANTGLRSTNRSGFRGVSRDRRSWASSICVGGKTICLGHFSAAEDAARAYDIAADEAFGSFASLNFPDELAVTRANPPQRRPLRGISGWARHFACCQRCGTTERKHEGHGLCGPCRNEVRREERRGAQVVAAIDADAGPTRAHVAAHYAS